MPQSVVARAHEDSSVPDMPGVKISPDVARELRIEVAALLQRQQLGFPGMCLCVCAHGEREGWRFIGRRKLGRDG